jgi:IclR family transcriptional regulator, KDG regulon repressor
MPYTIGAVDRALSLLEIVAENPGLGVTEIAGLTGNTKSLVFRLIFTLERRGYVIKDPATRTYTLGYRPMFLAANAHDQIRVLRAADPFLDQLAAQSRETVNLLVRDGEHSVCIATRQPAQPARLYAQLGRRGPLHVGGGPKILLAFAPLDVRERILAGPLQRFNDATIIDPAMLRPVLERIGRSGANESFGDLDTEAFSFAQAIRDGQGEVVAAVSVAGGRARLTEAKADDHRRLVREMAARISEALGYRVRLAAAV